MDQSVKLARKYGTRMSPISRMRKITKSGVLLPIIVILILLFIAGAANLIAIHDPIVNNLKENLLPPFWYPQGSLKYPLGTDLLGRDIFSRLVFGTRISLWIGFVVVMTSGVLGVIVGLISGFFGGTIDSLLMRVTDSIVALPTVLIALVFAATLGPGIKSVVLAISIPLWARIARMVRAETLSLKERDFVAYARLAGRYPLHIVILHILPNLLHTVIVLLTVQIGGIITLEASLSFIGVGVPAPLPSWGRMISDGRNYLMTAWWISTFPAIMIALTVLAFNLLGDWISDALNPRLKY
jgi:peptide/nickel transport system permease protein